MNNTNPKYILKTENHYCPCHALRQVAGPVGGPRHSNIGISQQELWPPPRLSEAQDSNPGSLPPGHDAFSLTICPAKPCNRENPPSITRSFLRIQLSSKLFRCLPGMQDGGLVELDRSQAYLSHQLRKESKVKKKKAALRCGGVESDRGNSISRKASSTFVLHTGVSVKSQLIYLRNLADRGEEIVVMIRTARRNLEH